MYTTTDFYLTATLAAMNKPHEDFTETDGHFTFIWDSDDIRFLAEQFYKKNLPVDARTFSDEIRKLKTLIHSLSGSAPLPHRAR